MLLDAWRDLWISAEACKQAGKGGDRVCRAHHKNLGHPGSAIYAVPSSSALALPVTGELRHTVQVVIAQVHVRLADRAVVRLRAALAAERGQAAAKAEAAEAEQRRERHLSAFTFCMEGKKD